MRGAHYVCNLLTHACMFAYCCDICKQEVYASILEGCGAIVIRDVSGRLLPRHTNMPGVITIPICIYMCMCMCMYIYVCYAAVRGRR
jgi:hypothetical protein